MAEADGSTAVLGVPPSISFQTWDANLREESSPLLAYSRAGYDYCVANQCDPAFIAGMYDHESDSGKKGAAVVTKSVGNTRQAYAADGRPLHFGAEPERNADGSIRLFENAPGSFFPVFGDPLKGLKSTVGRLVAMNWVYLGKGLRTVDQIIPVWAPSKDGNNTTVYKAAVLARMNTLRARERLGTGGTKLVRVALSAGHHNTSGGNEFEHDTTGLLVPRTAKALRRYGFDVVVVTPDGSDADTDPGDGEFPGGLDAVARKVVEIDKSGKRIDLFLEVHTEGVDNPATRGCFGIWPDNDASNDHDFDVRDVLIPAVISRMVQVVGAKRGTGAMSEKATGVGSTSASNRLGMFRETVPISDHTWRVIFECGTHSNPIERAIMRTERYLNGVAEAIAQGAAEAFGLPLSPLPPVDPTNPERMFFPETGQTLTGWFLDYWRAVRIGDRPAGLEVFGYPRTGEIVQDGRLVQYFDRARFELVPGGGGPLSGGVIGGLLGYEDAIRRGLILG